MSALRHAGSVFRWRGGYDAINARPATFNRHAIQGLHNKGRCLIFGECLTEGLTVRESAERCDFAVSTAFRWRHRFLGTQDQNPPNLKGIVEADETYVLESRKGDRNLDRKARRRGGKASKRGLSDEQVPILVAVDRSKTTTCSVLPSVTADNVRSVLEPRIRPGHRRKQRLSALRKIAWDPARSIEPISRGASTWFLSHTNGQQPPQSV